MSPTDSSARNFYQTIFESLGVPAIVVDGAGQIAAANQAFSSIFNITRPGQLKPVFLDLVAPDDQAACMDSIAAAQDGRSGPLRLDVRVRGADGEFEVEQLHLSAVANSSMVLLIFAGRLLDQPSARSRRQDEEFDSLFYLICHNLKSPAVSIQGFCKLLRETVVTGQEEVIHYVERIQDNALRLNAMVQDLLEFSSFSKASTTTDVDLSQVLADVRTEYYFPLKEMNVRLRVMEHLPCVRGDLRGLKAVFSNLVDNAIKYCGHLPDPEIRVSWEETPRFYVFRVEDNGPGLLEKYHDSVFELFERATAPEEVNGTGIGLALVKRIVEKHSGLVRFVSGRGQGAAVYFTLPKIAGCQDGHR